MSTRSAPEFIGCNVCYKNDDYCDNCMKTLFMYCPKCGLLENAIRLNEEMCKDCTIKSLQEEIDNLKETASKIITVRYTFAV